MTATQGGAETPLRVVLAKVGFDGHDRGLKVVARTLRDAGIEVVYLGLRQTVAGVVAAAEQEDVDVIGVSLHNGGHKAIAPALLDAVRERGLAIPVVIGGIVPTADLAEMEAVGVAEVLGPGASSEEVVATIRRAAGRA